MLVNVSRIANRAQALAFRLNFQHRPFVKQTVNTHVLFPLAIEPTADSIFSAGKIFLAFDEPSND